jgi:hypothetical protein
MHRLHVALACGIVLVASATGAQDAPASGVPAADIAPGAGREGVVHINAIKDPEMHTYRAIAAALDTFDDEHMLAPAVPQLRFSVRARDGGPLAGPMPTARLAADDFSVALPLDADALVTVPRSQAAWDAQAEFILSRKRKEVRVWPYVRTPRLADNQFRMGDVRLECRVMITIVKKEVPFWAVGLVNTMMMTGDWCGFFKDSNRTWPEYASAPISGAVLVEGNRSANLHVRGRQFDLPIGDTSWGNDALIELEFENAPATITP